MLPFCSSNVMYPTRLNFSQPSSRIALVLSVVLLSYNSKSTLIWLDSIKKFGRVGNYQEGSIGEKVGQIMFLTKMFSVHCMEYETDPNGNDIPMLPLFVDHFMACQEECQQHDLCNHFAFWSTTKQCFLKTARDNIRPFASIIHGPKFCDNLWKLVYPTNSIII